MAQLRMDLSCFSLFGHKRMPNIRRRVIKLLLVGSFLAWFILFSVDGNSGLVPSNPSLTAVRKNYGSCIKENPLSTMFDKDDTIGLGNCSFHWGSSYCLHGPGIFGLFRVSGFGIFCPGFGSGFRS